MNSPPWTARNCWEEMYLRLKQTSRNDDRMDGHRCHRTLLLPSLELTIAYLISISQLPITDTELAAMFHLDYTHDDDGELADELVLAREEADKLMRIFGDLRGLMPWVILNRDVDGVKVLLEQLALRPDDIRDPDEDDIALIGRLNQTRVNDSNDSGIRRSERNDFIVENEFFS